MSSRIASAHSELKAPLSPVTPSSERARMCFETSYRLAVSCVASIPAFSSPLFAASVPLCKRRVARDTFPDHVGIAHSVRGRRRTTGERAGDRRTALLLQWRPCRRDDLPQILEPGLPPELGGDTGRACHEHRWVPGAARPDLDGDRSPGHRACHVDHLLDAVPRTAATEVVRAAGVAT